MKFKSFLTLLTGIAATVLLAGCAGQPYVVFAPTGTGAVKPGSIAVVAGLGDRLSVEFAEQVTKDLEQESRFTVTTQRQITDKFSAYPADIIDDPSGFRPDDVLKFDRIQRGLGVDDILAVWVYNYEAETGVSLLGPDLRFTVGGRLLTYPSGKVSGKIDYYYGMGSLGKTQKEALHQMVVKSSEILVKKFLMETGAGKAKE